MTSYRHSAINLLLMFSLSFLVSCAPTGIMVNGVETQPYQSTLAARKPRKLLIDKPNIPLPVDYLKIPVLRELEEKLHFVIYSPDKDRETKILAVVNNSLDQDAFWKSYSYFDQPTSKVVTELLGDIPKKNKECELKIKHPWSQKGSFVFVHGECIAGTAHGNAVIHFKSYDGKVITIIRGIFDNGDLTWGIATKPSDESFLYIGSYKNAERDGYGIIQWSDNKYIRRAIGTFKKGKRNGFGTIFNRTKKKGSSFCLYYAGNYSDSKRNGLGLATRECSYFVVPETARRSPLDLRLGVFKDGMKEGPFASNWYGSETGGLYLSTGIYEKNVLNGPYKKSTYLLGMHKLYEAQHWGAPDGVEFGNYKNGKKDGKWAWHTLKVRPWGNEMMNGLELYRQGNFIKDIYSSEDNSWLLKGFVSLIGTTIIANSEINSSDAISLTSAMYKDIFNETGGHNMASLLSDSIKSRRIANKGLVNRLPENQETADAATSRSQAQVQTNSSTCTPSGITGYPKENIYWDGSSLLCSDGSTPTWDRGYWNNLSCSTATERVEARSCTQDEQRQAGLASCNFRTKNADKIYCECKYSTENHSESYCLEEAQKAL